MLSREQAAKDAVRSEPSHVRSQLVLVGHWATPEVSSAPSLMGRGSTGGWLPSAELFVRCRSRVRDWDFYVAL